MGSKVVMPGLLFAMVLLISTQVSARHLAEPSNTAHASTKAEQVVNVDRSNGGNGGDGGHGGNGGGGDGGGGNGGHGGNSFTLFSFVHFDNINIDFLKGCTKFQ